MWIELPTEINIIALKKACVRRWKKASSFWFIPKEKNIKPSCLRVDKATIFFISISIKPAILAINIVVTPVKRINWLISIVFINRINK